MDDFQIFFFYSGSLYSFTCEPEFFYAIITKYISALSLINKFHNFLIRYVYICRPVLNLGRRVVHLHNLRISSPRFSIRNLSVVISMKNYRFFFFFNQSRIKLFSGRELGVFTAFAIYFVVCHRVNFRPWFINFSICSI